MLNKWEPNVTIDDVLKSEEPERPDELKEK